MTAQHAIAPRTPAPRKSALRVAGMPGLRTASAAGGNPPPGRRTAARPGEPPSGKALRAMMISEFGQWLRSRTNKYDRPFAEETITAYKVAARALDAWMTRQRIEDDFSACDTPMLNRFFRDYHAAHGQSGANTKQRNLRHLFTWLEEEYGQPHPYTTKLNRYAPVRCAGSDGVLVCPIRPVCLVWSWRCRSRTGGCGPRMSCSGRSRRRNWCGWSG